MRRILLGLLLLVSLALLAKGVLSVPPFDCSFKNSCTGSEAAVFLAENTTGGYDNAHVQLNNYTGAAYNYSLCCSSDINHTLNASCANTTTIPVLRAANTTNTHAQIPEYPSYQNDICLGATSGNLTCEYVNSTCSAGYSPLMSMASSEGNNGTNAHVGNYSTYRLNVCCKLGKEPPSAVTLLYPVDGNMSVFERTVALNWTVAYEPDGDAVTYNISLNTSGSCAVEHQETGVSDSNFTTNELCTDQNYNWSVQACDIDGCSAWATTFNFTIASTIGLAFLQNTSTFAALIPLEINDTEAGPGVPMRLENTGNVLVNVSLNATGTLFTNAGLDNAAFQFKVAANESGSFSSGQTTYANVPSALVSAFVDLKYQDANDDGLIHYKVTVPADEPPGTKSTTITVRATVS